MDFGLLETLANRKGRKESPQAKTATQGQVEVKVGR